MEASALQAPATLPQTGVTIATPLLRFRTDEQLVALFRAGHDEAFRAIHDRYNKRLFAYTRQMLHGRQDAEDALQDVFVRAYSGLRASDHQLALRAWLFRVAHNRCIDELRRPAPPPPELLQLVRSTVHDPVVEVDLRESLRRLIEDIRRLPEQQRSALLMRELAGMSYADLAVSLGISVGAVKSLLVRARVSLAQAADARDTSCQLIREQLVESHDRGLRPSATARRHMRDCVGCKSFRRELRGITRQLAGIAPALGPLGVMAKLLGFSGGAGGGAAGGGGLALLGGGGATASAGGATIGVSHLATLLVAAVATAGGAVEIQRTIIAPTHHRARAAVISRRGHHPGSLRAATGQPPGIQAIVGVVEATVSSAPKLAATGDARGAEPLRIKHRHKLTAGGAGVGPATGASGLSRSSVTDSTNSNSDGSGTTGAGSGSTATGTAGCAGLLASGASGDETSTSSSTSGTAPAPSNATASASPCVVTSSTSPATSSSATTASPSGTGSDTSNSGSGSSASASASGPGSASPSSPSTGGSTSASK